MPREEIELKFKLDSPRPLRARIRALAFAPAQSRRREINWIFDDAQGRLRRRGQLLRLRRTGHEWLLTVKGQREPGPLKRRREEETVVADGAACRHLLELLGYRATLEYQRFRTTFTRPGQKGELAWDETPMGIYLEIEGTATWVRRTALQLGLALEAAEPRSYPDLYAAARCAS